MTNETNWQDSKYITNDEFVHLVLEKKSAPFLPLIVIGKVDFRGIEFEKSLYFTNIWFRGGVTFDTAKLGGDLGFSECRFDEPLKATDSRIAASVAISDCSFVKNGSAIHTAVNFDNTVIGGDFHLSDITGLVDDQNPKGSIMKGALSLCDATIDGSCSISKMAIGSRKHPMETAIYLDQSRIVGNLKIVPGAQSKQLTMSKTPDILCLCGGISAKGLTIGGDLVVGSNDQKPSTIMGNMNFNYSKIAGEVKINGFTNPHIENPLEKEKWLVNLSLSQVSCGACEIGRIQCEALGLAGSKSEGQLLLQGIDIKNPNTAGFLQPRADFSMVTCSAIFINNMNVEGHLYFVNTHVRSVIRIGSHNKQGQVFGGVNVEGDIEFSSACVDGQIDIMASIAKGVVRLNGTKCGSLLMKALNSTKKLSGIHDFVCKADDYFIQQDGKKQDKKYYIYRNRFGALDMVDCQFVSYVTLTGLEIIDPAMDEDMEDNTEPVFTGISIDACSFGNGIRFWKSGRSSSDGKKTRYTAWQNDLNRSLIDGRLEIRDCLIKGDLDLTRVYIHAASEDVPGHDHQIAEDEVFEGGVLHGGIILDRTKVEGDILFLSPASVSADLTQPKYLRRCARDYEIERKSRKLAQEKQKTEEQPDDELREVDRSAKAHFLQMKGTEANNIDLTGLSLKDPGDTLDEHLRHGHVIADRMALSGALTCFVASINQGSGHSSAFNREAAISRMEGYANIPGSLRLSGSEIGELSVSRKSFSKEIPAHNDMDQASGNALLDGLSLDGAIIGELTIHKTPLEFDDGAQSVFPYPINFSALKVNNWIFIDEQGEGIDNERDLAKCYTGVLENGELYRDVYRDVYRQLRNNGKNDAAVSVFVAEHNNAFDKLNGFRATLKGYVNKIRSDYASDEVRKTPSWFLKSAFTGLWTLFTAMLTMIWRRFFYKPIFARIMKYGAEPNMLGWVIVALIMLTGTMVATQPANFELAGEARLILASQDPNIGADVSRMAARGIDFSIDDQVIGPRPDHWGGIDAAWMTLRYHIPIIAIMARAEFEPTNDRGIQFIGMDKPLIDWLTPEDWFMIMALLNWALLPVLLTFWLNKILRNGEL